MCCQPIRVVQEDILSQSSCARSNNDTLQDDKNSSEGLMR